MKLFQWFEDRLRVSQTSEACCGTEQATWRKWWTLGMSITCFLLCVQLVTGFVLWAFYSPSAHTAWESVYYVQFQVPGGWLVRGIHYWAAQVLVGWLGLYVSWLIVRGLVRAPREFVFWSAMFLGLFALGACLTGDLLAWDREAYAATKTRVSFLNFLPAVGDDLFRVVAGGTEMGNATLTRFFALHVAVFGGGLILLALLHIWSARCAALPREAFPGPQRRGFPPLVHGLACVVAMAVVLAFVFAPAARDQTVLENPQAHLGAALGSPATPNPANAYKAARPEWSFRGIYGLSEELDQLPDVVTIFGIPSAAILVFLLMPFVGRLPVVGYLFNVLAVVVVAGGLGYFSYVSWSKDWENPEYLKGLAEEEALAERTVELIRGRGGVAPAGALAMLRNDPKLQGPRLFAQQCVSCHSFSRHDGDALMPEESSAADLGSFATRVWLEGLFDPEQIKSPEYFGNTQFAAGMMVRYVEGDFSQLPEEDQQAVITALLAEAGTAEEPLDPAQVQRGRALIAGEAECTRCHRFHDAGPSQTVGAGPDLTGYGSRSWLIGMIGDPTHSAFYGARNDRMPAFLEDPANPARNRLSAEQVAVLADWIRGDWYEPGEAPPKDEQEQAAAMPALASIGLWEGRSVPIPQPPEDDPDAAGRWLFLNAGCALCHAYTGIDGEDIVPASPAASDLGGFASEAWLRGLLDHEQISGPKYFGNSAFAQGEMATFVELDLPGLIEELGQEEFDRLVSALAAESQQGGEPAPPEEETIRLFEDFTCADCHKFHETGMLGVGPDLTGYGSLPWLKAIIADPTHERFYSMTNDGMPSYRAFEEDARNLLSEEQIETLARWLQRRPQQAE